MDGVEIARQIAAELHREAAETGTDPRLPYEFAVAEAKRRGIDVEAAEPGANLLDGGRAVFLPEDSLIVHENAGTRFEQAFLVAHEIGHAVLGDDVPRERAFDIDPARPAEPSPVGLDRVVDYGRRQRREVQMDLFARELLLPRPVLRARHVDEGLTASEIADRFEAPFDVVAQQLLDALLLPTVSSKSDPQRPPMPPNKPQLAAAGHRGEAFLLEAGPGTGKTQTVALRVEGLLEEGVDPRRILVLTFSNKAAGEMADRIARKHRDAAAAMWIGTFHAFGLDIIRRFHAELGLPSDPRLMDRTEAAELLEDEFPRLDLRHYRNLYDPTPIIADMLSAISRAKDEVVDAARYAELADAMLRRATDEDEREAGEGCTEVARVYADYERLKRVAHCVDFGDLVMLPVLLLEQNGGIRRHLQNEYDHVLVDEYQDVNRSSVRLLKALRPDGRNLWAVGDAKQSIYRFRGASSFNMARFGTEDFPDGKRGRLELNYRSVDEVVEAFSTFGQSMQAGGPASGLRSHRGSSGNRPEFRTVAQDPNQTVALAECVEEMHRAGYAYREQAILCTGNEKLSRLGQDLERLDIPVLLLGNLFARTEVKDLLSLLSLLIDRWAMGLTRIGTLHEFRMSISDIAAVGNHLRAANQPAPSWLADIEAIEGISTQGRAALRSLAGALRGFDQGASPWLTLATVLLDRTRIAAHLGVRADLSAQVRGIAIWQLMNFLRVQPAGRGLPIQRLLDRIRRLVRLGDDRDLRQLPAAAQGLDAVRLMTIHGSKGLEFEVTHVPGLNVGTIPRSASPPACPPPDGMVEGGEGSSLDVFKAGAAQEQECLFYVALSRARDRLFLYAPTQKSNRSSWRHSPFVDALGTSIDWRAVEPSREPLTAAEFLPVELAVEGGLRFSASRMALYERCPRRFFYTHVLELGGRRTATAFIQMHDAVWKVVEGLIADPRPVSNAELSRLATAAMAERGLAEHGYHEQLRELALGLLRFFVSGRADHAAEAPVAISVRFGAEEIVVRPDDVLVEPSGRRKLRRVRTGHSTSKSAEDVAAAAFVLAARQAFPDAVVELVHLSDENVLEVDLSATKLRNRERKLNGILEDIRHGHFPPNASPRTCPGCPNFFICGPVPDGVLEKRFV